MRRFAVGAAAWLDQLDLYFPFVVLPMNLALIFLWIWQYRADRRFLVAH